MPAQHRGLRGGRSKNRRPEHVKKVWIFPRDPFADRSEWLKGLKITLFDPEGKTADVLEKAHVPFKFTKNTSASGRTARGPAGDRRGDGLAGLPRRWARPW